MASGGPGRGWLRNPAVWIIINISLLAIAIWLAVGIVSRVSRHPAALLPSPTSEPTAIAPPPTVQAPLPTATATETPSTKLLYRADWSHGLNGWTADAGIKIRAVSGELNVDGSASQEENNIYPPYAAAGNDYAVEAAVAPVGSQLGLSVREDSTGSLDCDLEKHDGQWIAYLSSVTSKGQPIQQNQSQIRGALPSVFTVICGAFSRTAFFAIHYKSLLIAGNSLVNDGGTLLTLRAPNSGGTGRLGLWVTKSRFYVGFFRVYSLRPGAIVIFT